MTPSDDLVRLRAAGSRRLVVRLLVVTLLMFGFGFSLVPIYRAVCSALGFNVIASNESFANSDVAAARNSQVDTSRTVTVEFDANARGPWDFKPEQASIDVHPGQIATVMYSFHNRQNRAMTLQAIPSYAPAGAMAHFTKLECFCFSQQVLQAGESKRWPVVFVVDSKLPKDIKTITLSYTFFEVGGKIPAAPDAMADVVPALRS
jgi:cytochrome c oxidase assembly protein subunit 11